MMQSGVGLSRDNVDMIAKEAAKEEGENMARAAKDTILTLQSIIDDKTAQIQRKETEITKMKKKFMEE